VHLKFGFRPYRKLVRTILVGLLLAGTGPSASAQGRPKRIDLPNGFQPEGIVNAGTTFFAGSTSTGDIFRGDLTTGEGEMLIDAPEGRSAIGLAWRTGMLFVSGGSTGQVYVYDGTSGEELFTHQFTTENSFINDVEATENAAYWTDSVNPVIYKLPINGKEQFGTPQTIALTGDLVYEEGFNVNGIEASPDGQTLLLVQSNTGLLFKADPYTGETQKINLHGKRVPNGDGILLDRRKRGAPDCRRANGGSCLWVLQNQDELITTIYLKGNLNSGSVIDRVTYKTFDVPTTLDRSGAFLAIVNARFGTESPETADYWVTQIRRPIGLMQ
jgi:sugar lactone lactonase YvrE